MGKLNVLVTGGAGYIGSHIVKDLCANGHNVTVFDNFSLGLHENIDDKAEVIEGDVLSKDDLNKAFQKKIDVVFHFAAWKAAGESMINPYKYAENNICGTLNLINAMIANEVKHFVFSSSAAVYGEPQYLPIDENHPKQPENYYGYSKLAIEENLNWFSKLKGLNYAALRYFNATGYDVDGKIKGREKNPANLSPIVMETAAGEREKMQVFGDDYDTPDGTCIRDYIHVTDLSYAHLLAMEYIINKNENLTVNLGTGEGSSVFEVINAAEKVTGTKVKYEVTGRREGDPRELVASSDLAFQKLGWKAKYSDLETIFSSMKTVYFQ
jgi:UDP-glucose 4-epimerase